MLMCVKWVVMEFHSIVGCVSFFCLSSNDASFMVSNVEHEGKSQVHGALNEQATNDSLDYTMFNSSSCFHYSIMNNSRKFSFSFLLLKILTSFLL